MGENNQADMKKEEQAWKDRKASGFMEKKNTDKTGGFVQSAAFSFRGIISTVALIL